MTAKPSYRANPVVSYKDEGDEGAVLYNPDNDKVVIVNAVGAKTWLYLVEPRTIGDIATMLVETYSGVDVKQGQEDAEKFIANFDEGFLNEIS